MKNYNVRMIKKKPYVTIGLVIINFIVFLSLEFLGDTEDSLFMILHGGMFPEAIINGEEYWRFFTAMFLHFGLIHLTNNMIVLGAAGEMIEDTLGHLKFLVLYIMSGIGGSVVSFLLMNYTGDYAVSAGASGAIFGVIGALVWIVIKNKGNYKALNKTSLIIMVALMLYQGFESSGVDNGGHIGGLLSGFLLSIVLYRKKGYNES